MEIDKELEEGRNGRASSGDKVQGAKGKGRASSADKVEEVRPPEKSSSADRRREERQQERESSVDEGSAERRDKYQTSSSAPVVIKYISETARYHSEMPESVAPPTSTSSIITTTTATTAIAAAVDAITTTVPALGRYYTSLGVVVDTCSWNQQRPHDKALHGGGNEDSSASSTGRRRTACFAVRFTVCEIRAVGDIYHVLHKCSLWLISRR